MPELLILCVMHPSITTEASTTNRHLFYCCNVRWKNKCFHFYLSSIARQNKAKRKLQKWDHCIPVIAANGFNIGSNFWVFEANDLILRFHQKVFIHISQSFWRLYFDKSKAVGRRLWRGSIGIDLIERSAHVHRIWAQWNSIEATKTTIIDQVR